MIYQNKEKITNMQSQFSQKVAKIKEIEHSCNREKVHVQKIFWL